MTLEGFRGEGGNREADAESFANRFLGETGICLCSTESWETLRVLRVDGWSAGVSV